MSARVRAALDDVRCGKACVDNSLTALADYLESDPLLEGLAPRCVEVAQRNLASALKSLAMTEKMLRFLEELTSENRGGTT